MLELIPPEGASEEQVDAFLSSLRAGARAHVHDLLAAGTSEAEIAEYIASLEPASDEAPLTDEGGQ